MGEIIPFKIGLDASAEDLFEQKMGDYYRLTMNEQSQILRPVISRFREHFKKLAMINAISSGRKSIAISDLVFADEFLMVGLHNCSRILAEAGAENKIQSEKERLYSLILAKPGITKNELTRSTQFLPGTKYRENLLLDLEEAQVIIRQDEISISSKRKLSKFYAVKVRDTEQ